MTIKPIATIVAISIFGVCTVLAAETSDVAPATPSKQAREQMALLHEKLAACLRSERALAECRSEMMRSCHAMKAERNAQACGMGMMDHERQDKGTAEKSGHSDHKH